MDSLVELFCDVDDFCQEFMPIWEQQMLANGSIQRKRKRSLTMSEIMTILIAFHQSHYRNFKAIWCCDMTPTKIRAATFLGASRVSKCHPFYSVPLCHHLLYLFLMRMEQISYKIDFMEVR